MNYAGLPDDKHHALSKKYCPKGAGAVFTFGLKGGYEAGVKAVSSVKLLSHLANIGDTRSLIIHPASTTHSQLSTDQLKLAGASPDVVRLSIGIEDVDDIIADLDQAICAERERAGSIRAAARTISAPPWWTRPAGQSGTCTEQASRCRSQPLAEARPQSQHQRRPCCAPAAARAVGQPPPARDHIGEKPVVELHRHRVLEQVAPAWLHDRSGPGGTRAPSISGQVL